MPDSPPVFALVGPTGCGKTAVSLALAELMGVEIVCGDSRQIYREINIATGKPTPGEMDRAPHHLFDRFSVSEEVSAGRYAETARPILRRLTAGEISPLVVGGSGFYLKALYHGLSPVPEVPPSIRESLQREWEGGGGTRLFQELQEVDPALAKRLPPGDRQRITRGLEVFRSSGKPLSWWHDQPGPGAGDPALSWRFVGIHRERDSLYQDLDRRTRSFFEGGLLEEIQGLLDSGVPMSAPGLNSIGYDQALLHLKKELSLEEALKQAQQETRRYAKRQVTWWRSEGQRIAIEWFERSEGETHTELGERIFARLREPVT